ncbi:hypothetical protein ACFX2F_017193 [Malus domestica]|uniref:probable acyl-[acyl-carrier-protein]--UDP-N-acetylglucosamine O-acyltransferase, mitochondrial n=1 Tax=Malus domestica TaxID=3750 RepID=UPI0010AAA395|nr:probable acyl-[acyl-carrier-protein]--UDP-N-acetylglucosamine O-acyltransferase, mitochondrial [Malus domestica]
MGSCHIAHDCKIGNNIIFVNNTLLAGHVVEENYAHTAGAVVVHQFCHVGSFSFISGGSVIAQDVPKYMMVAGERAVLRGLNLEGLRHNGFTAVKIRSLRTVYQKIFMPADKNSRETTRNSILSNLLYNPNSLPGISESSIDQPMRLAEIYVTAENALHNTVSNPNRLKSLSST